MKNKISDLLDGYPADIDLEFTTPLSSSRIEELTMKQIGQTGAKKRHFSPRVAVMAAAAAALLCVSALAAGNVLGVGDWFRSYFGGDLSDGQMEVLGQIGRTFQGPEGTVPDAVTDNGATITPLAALADENTYYLRLRIEAPEGIPLPDLDGETEGYYQLSGDSFESRIHIEFGEENYSHGYSTMFFWQPDTDPADSRKEVVVRISKQAGTDLNFRDGVSKRLVISGLWVQSTVKDYTPVFTGNFSFDIGLSYEGQTLPLNCAGLTWQGELLGGYTNTLKSMTLSSLSLSYDFSTDLLENDCMDPELGPVEIGLKDGSIFYSTFADWADAQDVMGQDLDSREIHWEDKTYDDKQGYIIFDEPLELDQVSYIRYGENRIDVASAE